MKQYVCPLSQVRQLDVAANRRQRRPQLMRNRHQEVALELLGLLEPLGHLAEARRQQADLVVTPDRRELDVVVALRDLVGRFRQRQHRLGDATREVPGQRAGHENPHDPCERQPLDQRHPPVPQLGRGLGDD